MVTPPPVVPVRVSVTPGMPGSPASWQPLALTSFQTKSPTVTGMKYPQSRVRSLPPPGKGEGVVPEGLGLLSRPGPEVGFRVGEAVNPNSAPPAAKLLASTATV